MSRRRYDHRRVAANEMRRLKLSKNLLQILGPAHRTPLDEMLGIRMDDPVQSAANHLVSERYDRAISRPCAYGNCTEQYDPKTRTVLGSLGPAVCPCGT